MASSCTHLDTITLQHLPSGHELHIALYKNVTNAAFLHAQLLAGNTEFEYAFVDASVILSRMHILASAFRAVNDLLANKLRSRNIHSEIVFCLSPNNNIATSFRTLGLTSTTPSIIVLKLSTPSVPFTASQMSTHLSSSISGENILFTDDNLASMVDLARVRKVYKLNGVGGVGGVALGGGKVNGVETLSNSEVNGDGKEKEEREREREKKELEILVLGTMALRGHTT